MKTEINGSEMRGRIFIDDWPKVEKSGTPERTSIDIKKWRFQQVLANHPWGIPSLAFLELYKKIFGKELDIEEMGHRDFPSLVASLQDIFTVQQPDDITALIFPAHPFDVILHDARFDHNFEDVDRQRHFSNDFAELDFNLLIAQATFNRDQDFPSDVILAGEKYRDIILPQTLANIQGTRGVHRVLISAASNPQHFFINTKSEHLEKVSKFSNELANYYSSIPYPSDSHVVPDEFIYPGFPCAAFMSDRGTWERCSIITKSHRASKVLVESVDFGGISTVSRMHLFLMPKRFIEVPKQALCVSLIGIKPSKERKYSQAACARLRCFSHINYFLDCVLMEPMKQNSQVDSDNIQDEKIISKKKKKRQVQPPQFEIMLCDRNDEELDIYVDEILILETYANIDDERREEIEKIRGEFKSALKDITRPENPLNDIQI